MFVITQGYLGPLVVTQGYASGEVVAGNDPYDVQKQHCWSSGLARGFTFQPGAGPSNVFSSGAVAGNVQE